MRNVAVRLVSLVFSATMLGAATLTVDVGPGNAFLPPSVTVQPGDTVTWSFVAPFHTTTSDATSGPEVWNSGIVSVGGTFSHVFSTVGSHPYHCAIHSFAGGTAMNGVVMVAAPAAPVLTLVAPSSGPTAGGTSTTLTGSDFVADCAASFGGAAAASTFVDATTLQATAPAHAAGSVDVTVTCSTGSSTLSGAFTYADALIVTAVVPPSAASGTEVVIQGSNFDPAVTVQFDGVAAIVTFIDATTIRAVVPALATGPVTITVTNPTGAPGTILFTVLAATAEIPLMNPLVLLMFAVSLAIAGWKGIR